jgi:hypothetical protein
MQTFLPYSSFEKSAQVLDNKRLNKQHVEAYQLINTIEQNKKAWRNHPACRMWENNVDALKEYANIIKQECLNRNFKSEKIPFYNLPKNINYPKWLGWKLFHISMQSNLVRKNSEFYSKYGWRDYGIEGYFWPIFPKTKKAQQINEEWVKIIIE